MHKKIFETEGTEQKQEATDKSQTFAPFVLTHINQDSTDNMSGDSIETAVTAAQSTSLNFARGSMPVKSSSMFGFDTGFQPSEAPTQPEQAI